MENKYKLNEEVYFKDHNGFKSFKVKEIKVEDIIDEESGKSKEENIIIYYGDYENKQESEIFPFKNDKEATKAKSLLDELDSKEYEEKRKIGEKYEKEKDKIIKSFKNGTYDFNNKKGNNGRK